MISNITTSLKKKNLQNDGAFISSPKFSSDKVWSRACSNILLGFSFFHCQTRFKEPDTHARQCLVADSILVMILWWWYCDIHHSCLTHPPPTHTHTHTHKHKDLAGSSIWLLAIVTARHNASNILLYACIYTQWHLGGGGWGGGNYT